MKKMSEVFELPLTGASLEFHLQNTEFCTEQDHAAHAINHVDALAHSVWAMIEVFGYNDQGTARDCLDVAKKALAAYRGEK